MQDPRTSAKIVYTYTQLGIGAGVSYKGLKKQLSGAAESSPSTGSLYMTEAFEGVELSADDIEGLFINAEGSLGVGMGGSINGLLLGISTKNFLKTLARGGSMGVLATLARAALLMGGQGWNLGISAAGYTGYLWQSDVIAEAALLELRTIEEALSTKWAQTAREDAPPIVLPGDILFDFDKYSLKPTALAALKAAGAKVLFSHSGKHIQIQGFADGIGGDSRHNQELSENRAAAVKDWLIANGFVRSGNVSSRGYGIEYPIASNQSASGRAKNRRVEIHILSHPPK